LELIGYVRQLARGITIEDQTKALVDAGVGSRFIYRDVLATKKITGREMFGEALKALRRGDILAVPSLGIFGRSKAEVSEGMFGLDMRGVLLWSIGDGLDMREADPEQLYKLNRGMRAAEALWKRQRTVKATEAARQRVGRTGRRPKLSSKQETAARLAWATELDRTNDEIGREYGLSAGRLWAKFGPRPERE
jgi:DNA invertase Pin-like site-specific DNA recombinase